MRQLIRSAIRDCAVCRIGALWPSSRPATTTATTPEAWISSAARKQANGITNDSPTSSTGSVIRRRSQRDDQERADADQHAAAGGDHEVEADVPRRDADRRGASAVRSATSAVASLKQRLALEDRDDPARQPDACGRSRSRPPRPAARRPRRARTRSARRRRAAARAPATPTPDGGEEHQPDRQQQDRAPVGVEVDQRRRDRGRVEQRRQQPEQHHLGLEVDLRHERQERRRDARRRPAAAARARRSGRRRRRRRARRRRGRPGRGRPPRAHPRRRPCRVAETVRQASAGATQSIGSPQPSSPTPCLPSASATSVRRWAAKVSTCGDHPAVGEDLGGLAQRVDEGVVEAAGVDDRRARGRGTSGPRPRSRSRIDAQRLVLLDRPVVVAGRERGVPHAHLADQPRQQRADRLPVVVDVELDRPGRAARRSAARRRGSSRRSARRGARPSS